MVNKIMISEGYYNALSAEEKNNKEFIIVHSQMQWECVIQAIIHMNYKFNIFIIEDDNVILNNINDLHLLDEENCEIFIKNRTWLREEK